MVDIEEKIYITCHAIFQEEKKILSKTVRQNCSVRILLNKENNVPKCEKRAQGVCSVLRGKQQSHTE